MVSLREVLVAAGAVGLFVAFSTGGCGSSKADLGPGSDDGSSSGGDDSGSGGSSGSSGFQSIGAEGGPAQGCMNGDLSCSVPPNCTTSISGTVYDPAGVNPLYNVVVYIPEDPAGSLSPITTGTNTCSSCDVSIGDYVTATTSGQDGKFTLNGVPAGSKIPLVVQIGKWRREVFLPTVKACTNNVLTGSASTRLPANHTEGNIPQMALVTGGADNLGCFLKGIGLDPAEYSAPHAGGRLDIYQGLPAGQSIFGTMIGGAPGLSTGTAGDCTTDNANCVWNSKANLEKYDIVLLACEGNTYDLDDSDYANSGGRGGGTLPTNKSMASKAALHDWLNEGGKVFATHFHYTWFKNSPDADFKAIATWLGTSGGSDTGKYDIDTSFPKGMVFNSWLQTVGALTGTQIDLSSVAESVGTVNAAAQRWIYNPAKDPQQGSTNDTKYMSIVTPIGGIPVSELDAGESTAQYCGKAVFSDLHAGGDPTGNIPGTGDSVCPGPPLTAQLKALEFLFFDLSACVSIDSIIPPPPPPPTK